MTNVTGYTAALAAGLLLLTGCNRAESPREVAKDVAEADHKVAIESCEILEGDAQQTCKNEADAQLAASKAEAERLRPPGS